MGKPFSDLEKRALAILANGGNPASSQDQELAKYWAWRINPSLASHDLDNDSIRTTGRKLDDVGIRPFGLNLEGTTVAKATISNRTISFLNGELTTALQHVGLTPETTAYRLANFRPAKVYARTGAGDNPVPRTSRITGRKYKSYYAEADQGYTMPFGRTTATTTVYERQAVITAALKAKNQAIELISFSPEKARP